MTAAPIQFSAFDPLQPSSVSTAQPHARQMIMNAAQTDSVIEAF
jgi:hypothetical protein